MPSQLTVLLTVLDDARIDAALQEIRDEPNWRCAYLDEARTIFCRTQYTGHMYYNSPYETCDSCGNCSGAKCDYCRIEWILTEIHDGGETETEIATVFTDSFSDTEPVKRALREYIEKKAS